MVGTQPQFAPGHPTIVLQEPKQLPRWQSAALALKSPIATTTAKARMPPQISSRFSLWILISVLHIAHPHFLRPIMWAMQ